MSDDSTSDPGFERESDLVQKSEKAKGGSDFSWSLAVFLLIGLGFVVFAVQNTDNVNLRFLRWEFTVALPLLLVVTALIAVIADEIVGLIRRRRRRQRMAEREELKRYRGT
ncbi:MAG TPA: lipopolysaccharide assembly protein LapA domain-containing protein [Acidimicrobiia bacterium]|nr:lipopolysaccharide assembly protein LapA domain-containing protein [Acidimicrobiia bacterium]